jgi:hypothetical protein
MAMTSTARRNSKFIHCRRQIQNSKLIQRKRFVDLEWLVYLRHAVLVITSQEFLTIVKKS